MRRVWGLVRAEWAWGKLAFATAVALLAYAVGLEFDVLTPLRPHPDVPFSFEPVVYALVNPGVILMFGLLFKPESVSQARGGELAESGLPGLPIRHVERVLAAMVRASLPTAVALGAYFVIRTFYAARVELRTTHDLAWAAACAVALLGAAALYATRYPNGRPTELLLSPLPLVFVLVVKLGAAVMVPVIAELGLLWIALALLLPAPTRVSAGRMGLLRGRSWFGEGGAGLTSRRRPPWLALAGLRDWRLLGLVVAAMGLGAVLLRTVPDLERGVWVLALLYVLALFTLFTTPVPRAARPERHAMVGTHTLSWLPIRPRAAWTQLLLMQAGLLVAALWVGGAIVWFWIGPNGIAAPTLCRASLVAPPLALALAMTGHAAPVGRSVWRARLALVAVILTSGSVGNIGFAGALSGWSLAAIIGSWLVAGALALSTWRSLSA